MKTLTVLALLALLCAMAWVRLYKIDAEKWHKRPELRDVGEYPAPGGFAAVLNSADPAIKDLARLAALIQDTPRTVGLAGSLEDRHLSFVTRSTFWGFPDVTNIALIDNRLVIEGHLVLGRSDLGVNRNRIQNWLQALRQAR